MATQGKWLGNMTIAELAQAYNNYQRMVEIDEMADKLGIEGKLQGNINNPNEWQMIERIGNDDLYPLAKAVFQNVATGEMIKGMFNEQTGDKLLGEIIQ